MKAKVVYFSLLAASLIIGCLIGRFIPMFERSHRWLSRGIGFTGFVVCFIGLVGADEDHRFLILAAGGLGLQLAWLVSSFKNKKNA